MLNMLPHCLWLFVLCFCFSVDVISPSLILGDCAENVDNNGDPTIAGSSSNNIGERGKDMMEEGVVADSGDDINKESEDFALPRSSNNFGEHDKDMMGGVPADSGDNIENDNDNFTMPRLLLNHFGGRGKDTMFNGLHTDSKAADSDLEDVQAADDDDGFDSDKKDSSSLPNSADKNMMIEEDDSEQFGEDRKGLKGQEDEILNINMKDSSKIPPCYKQKMVKDHAQDQQQQQQQQQQHSGRKKINNSTKNTRQQPPLCFKRKMSKASIFKLINIIERMLSHFSMYTKDIIADGLLGLRATEIILKTLSKKLSSNNKGIIMSQKFSNPSSLRYTPIRGFDFP